MICNCGCGCNNKCYGTVCPSCQRGQHVWGVESNPADLEGIAALSGSRVYDKGSEVGIFLSSNHIGNWASRWPGLSWPSSGYFASFNKSNGDLVEFTTGRGGDTSRWDGEGVIALLDDARAYAMRKLGIPESNPRYHRPLDFPKRYSGRPGRPTVSEHQVAGHHGRRVPIRKVPEYLLTFYDEALNYELEDIPEYNPYYEENTSVRVGTIASSDPHNEPYSIMRDDQGNYWCTCLAWKYQRKPSSQRTCKHIEMYLRTKGPVVAPPRPMPAPRPQLPPPPIDKSPYDIEIVATEREMEAVEEMSPRRKAYFPEYEENQALPSTCGKCERKIDYDNDDGHTVHPIKKVDGIMYYRGRCRNGHWTNIAYGRFGMDIRCH